MLMRGSIGELHSAGCVLTSDIIRHGHVDEEAVRTFKQKLGRSSLRDNSHMREFAEQCVKWIALKKKEADLISLELDANEKQLVEELIAIDEWLRTKSESFESDLKRLNQRL
jgi:hypothetical protein